MKKFFFFAALLCAQIGWANVVTGEAAIPDKYYDGVDGKSSPDAILDALFNKIKDHTSKNYKNLEDYYEQTDFRGDSVWDMYSTCYFTMAKANVSQKAVCDGWNKEHSIPQSWFSEATPMKSDLFHVYPTDARVNNLRNNHPYGEVNGGRGTGISNNTDNHALGKVGSNTFPGFSGTVYEPDDEYKGDFARTYFYMVARYRDKTFTSSGGDVVFTANKTNLTEYARNLFLKWHRQDPVSQKEIDRNQAVYGIQHNRNPFIDYPELAEYVWGNKAGQQVDLASMTPTCEGGDTIPPTPPTPTVKYGVTWSVNGEELQVDSIKENNKVTALPDEPTSCSTQSTEFMGWTTAPISGSQDDAPAVLYKAAKDIPAITADITLYAVFAKQTTTQSSQVESTETIDLSTGFADKQEVTSVSGSKVTLTFDGGTNNNKPRYFTNGNAVRLYGSNSMTVTANNITGIVLTYGSNDGSNPISTNVGTFSTDTWTGSANAVIFTVGGTSGNRRIASVAVTTNGAGSTTAYSRYITSCQTTTEIEEAPVKGGAARKVLIGSTLYIQTADGLYTITGQRAK